MHIMNTTIKKQKKFAYPSYQRIEKYVQLQIQKKNVMGLFQIQKNKKNYVRLILERLKIFNLIQQLSVKITIVHLHFQVVNKINVLIHNKEVIILFTIQADSMGMMN